MTDWKQLLEKRRGHEAREENSKNGTSKIDFKKGHASIEPLLLKAIAALEMVSPERLTEIKAELELNEKE